MASINNPVAELGSSGRTIPLVGFGAAEFPFKESDHIRLAVVDAIEAGYRHFDTAAVYLSEKALGNAVADALRLGLIKTRAELFITTKLWLSDAHSDRVLPALRSSLQDLGMDYVDLYLMHWPVSLKPGKPEFPKKEDLLPIDLGSVWKAMEECQELGLAKSIGVSNFSSTKLDLLLSTARIPPAVNQVEVNPLWQQKKLRGYCKAKGIHVTAYSPLGSGSKGVMECQVLKDIATAKGKSLAQVCLRWLHEQGVSFVTKSFNKGRMKQNLEIFDWKLSPEELEKIDQIPQHRGSTGDFLISEDGPFKSLEELWDE